MLGKVHPAEKLTFKQSPGGKMWVFGRKTCEGVEMVSAKALRQECVGDIRGAARRPMSWS